MVRRGFIKDRAVDNFNFDYGYAYAMGYYAGRAIGEAENPFAYSDPCRALYARGYDRGVADWTDVALLPPDEEAAS